MLEISRVISQVFDLRPARIIEELRLKIPFTGQPPTTAILGGIRSEKTESSTSHGKNSIM